MKHQLNSHRPRDTRVHGPRSLGGLVSYLLVFPAFVAVLAVPGIVLAASLGVFSGLLVAKLGDRSLLPVVEKDPSQPSSRTPEYR